MDQDHVKTRVLWDPHVFTHYVLGRFCLHFIHNPLSHSATTITLTFFSCCCSCSLLNANPRPDGEGGRRRTTGDERNVVAVSECADGDSTSTCSLPSSRRRRRRRPAGFDLSPTTAAGGGAQRGKKIFSAPAPLRPSGVRARHSQSASQRHSGRRPPFLPRVGGRERAEQRARRRPPSPLRPPQLSRRSQRRLPSLRSPSPRRPSPS